jgi:YegS/Rv2252/BmrU family lipid kinase
MNKVLLLYNPNAGNGVIKNHLDEIIHSFGESGVFVVPYRLGGQIDIEKVMSGLSESEFDLLIAAGGDGTVNLVVNSMLRNDVNIPLAIFPTGTANDLAGHLGIPMKIEGMIKTALSDETIKVDIGKAGDRFFVNVLAIGMLVDISQKTDPLIKNTFGLGAYYLRSLAEIPFARANKLRIISKECTLTEDVSAVLVLNGRGAGGFKDLVPMSEVSDGLLDVLVVRKLILPVMLPALLTVLMGHHLDDKRFEYFRTDRLRIEPVKKDDIVGTDVDGEKGDPLPLDIEVLPGRLLLKASRADSFASSV